MSRVVIEETIRRHVTHIGYVSAVAVMAMLGLSASRFATPGAAWSGPASLLAIVVGCRLIGPEFSSGTLQLILVKPIRRSTYLLSRVAGAVCAVWLPVVIAFAAETAGRMAQGSVPWRTLVHALVSTAAAGVLTIALLALFGSFSHAYYNVLIYITLSLFLGALPVVLRFLKAPDSWGRALAPIEANLYPSLPTAFDTRWLLMVLSNAAVALVLACLFFRNREVPYGAD
jgi:hypothetical protein